MREEPRSMTLGDVIAMVAGIGLGMAASPRISGGFSPGVALVFSVTWGLWALSVMLAVVVAARLVRFRRCPRAAEWLAILLAVSGVALRPEWGIDRAVAMVFASWRKWDVTFAMLRWWLAAPAALAVVMGLLALGLGHRVLPPWLKSATLAALAGLALWGPIEVVALQGPDLLTPVGGFGAGDGWVLYRRACILIAQVPFALVFFVPLVAAIAERVARRPWSWAEWASFALAIIAGLLLPSVYPSDFDRSTFAYAAERVMSAGWVLGVAILARWVGINLGPAWRRWLGTSAV